MNWLRKQKVEIQRSIYRMRQKRNQRIDLRMHKKAINKANRLSKRMKKRLWVLREAPGVYHIYTKPQMKAAARTISKECRLPSFNFYQTGEYIVHITQRPD